MEKINYTVKEVEEMLGIGRNKAYDVINELNAELKKAGFLTTKKTINKAFFDSKIFK